MTTRVTIKVDHVGCPTGKVVAGTVFDNNVSSYLYEAGQEVDLYVHGGARIFVREATETDVADRSPDSNAARTA